MNKKQKISWGVSFGSLALVAGMTSYLGFSTGSNQEAAPIQQQSGNGAPSQQGQNQYGFQSGQGQDSFNSSESQSGQDSFGYGSRHDRGRYGSEDSGQIYEGDDSSTSDNGFSPYNGSENQFSNQAPNFGHEGGFDTTTGGT